MSEFFSHYPQIDYNITGKAPAKYKTVINILSRAKFKNIVGDSIVAYLPYSIPEGERPDITAHKTYGDVKYTWLIFLINDIHDPIYEWPLGSRDFTNYIRNKYGSINACKDKVHHYEQVVRPRVEARGTTEPLAKNNIIVDLTTYNNLDDNERGIVYCFEYEVDLNESKRDIKLVDPRFAATIFGEHSEKYEI